MAKAARPVEAPAYFLEAHYYSGGLRFKHLGVRERPAWAPDAERVGFRNEFELRESDAVVEFYRIGRLGEKLTWIGIFYRAPDQRFGDRQNHAGMGIWLRDLQIVDADKLLYGLRQFAKGVADQGDAENLEDKAAVFLGREFLGSYVAPSEDFAEQMQGWAFTSPEASRTEIYTAFSTDLDAAWEKAADQILRLNFLPGPTAQHSRALILVSDQETDLRPANGAKVSAIKGNSATQLLDVLPTVGAETRRSNHELTDKLATAEDQIRILNGRLAQSEKNSLEARQSFAELQKLVEANDTLKALLRMGEMVEDVKKLGRSTQGYVQELMEKTADNTTILKRLEIKPVQSEPRAIRRDFTPEYMYQQTRRLKKTDWTLLWALIAGVVIAAALIVLVIYLRNG